MRTTTQSYDSSANRLKNRLARYRAASESRIEVRQHPDLPQHSAYYVIAEPVGGARIEHLYHDADMAQMALAAWRKSRFLSLRASRD